jgi:carbon starvation protein
VWLLLAPRDYLSTFMKLGTIFTLVVGIFIVLPDLRMPAVSRFVDGSGLVVAGKVFPFCFIVIACGAISGFHTLIASGTTPKLITRESFARPIGYGAMCLESLVAIMALIAACTLDPGVYLSMNVKGDPAAVVSKISALGFPVTVKEMDELATQIGEKSLFGRTGGAATLAVGMANIFSKAVSGRWLDLWYHFAIMFEALFILTTIDAGTRVGRYLLQDVLGHLWSPLGETGNLKSNLLASLLMVSAWGWFLVQGVRDPLGGINSLWPLFGIANQMLAAIALCLGTTIILKMSLCKTRSGPGGSMEEVPPRPALALITLLPLAWLIMVTFTAGWQKIYHPDPRIGFLSQSGNLKAARPALEQGLAEARLKGDDVAIVGAEKALRDNRTLDLNNMLDAVVAKVFLLLAALIVLLSAREWYLLLSRRKAATLYETDPVWLNEMPGKEGNPLRIAGTVGLAVALARELSGEAHLARAQEQAAQKACCQTEVAGDPDIGKKQSRQKLQETYVRVSEERYRNIRRCC